MVKLANNTYFQLGVLMSSAMVGQTIGLNQSAQASELNNPLTQHLVNAKKNGSNKINLVQSPQNFIFSPQSFNLIAFSWRSKSVNSSVDNPITSDSFKLVAPLSQPKQTSLNANQQKLYLANTQSLPKNSSASSLVYQVKEGDTITKIASQYQITSHELIEFNQIQDSNVIFVDQRLQIPLQAIKTNRANSHSVNSHVVNSHNKAITPRVHSAIGSATPEAIAKINSGINPSKSSNKSYIDSSSQPKTTNKITKTSLISAEDSTFTEDPYIANLRAEIEQLRQQNAPQDIAPNTLKQSPQDTGTGKAIAASLVSVTEQQSTPRAKLNSSGASATFITENLIKENSLALKLPPLPSPQAYLPDIFDGYAWPAEGVVTSHYGMRWGRMHEGIDIAAPIGTPILAAAAGVVTGAGWHEGYGNLVQIEHLDGSVTLYGHINRFLVTHGQQVKQGEQIAEMGNTGRSTGPHLHFEIHLPNKQVVDPQTMLSNR
jgi:murein DD-endopeptidase MepM/ murein hydrolase activator NlpD